MLATYEEPAPDDAASDLSELSELFELPKADDVLWQKEDALSDQASDSGDSDGEACAVFVCVCVGCVCGVEDVPLFPLF